MGAIAAAVVFAWLGMVLAISFIEAPLKFRAPGITLQLGLGIGRLVFRALNTVEIVLATVVVVAVVTHPPGRLALAAISVAVTMLLLQSLFVRPRLRRRSDAVLAAPAAPPGGMRERSQAHYAYAGLEVVKVVGLLTAGTVLQLWSVAG
ncbi:hypothetical protein [Mycolicibacter senuensis]|uniref:DUF4149 domain-containing protein n=1 Tax=Mycolicibacter senuensis TaxID=386913 RepID=A0A7I9XEP3_9MYCO|nr:hypothetical protein [Mycolicibacter senuensis]MDQ2628121.1 hypothetical protein [Actinomycetota bacterium]ORW64812.1 hypothetical protein AWC24_20480 [Mycolicibacter senuensis]GFG68414.1 hypothetical protein MSEN_01340 [Mycolicibacter senuensis]